MIWGLLALVIAAAFAGACLFDVWLYRPGEVVGLTCCQAEDLMNRRSMLTRRIDLILTV